MLYLKSPICPSPICPAWWRSVILCGLVLFVLAACNIELYRSIPEREANLMIAILHNHGLGSYKEESDPKGTYSVWVEESEFSQAVKLLAAQGYPRRMRANLADLFKPSGLVPTQFEEQVRYVYGLSEELAHTISLLEGVIDTRVHIALPNKSSPNQLGRVSVYVKYDQDVDFASLIPQIKKLISDSIESVIYKNVEVLAIPSYVSKDETGIISAYKFPAGIRVLPEYYNLFIAMMIAILLIITQTAGAAIWFYWQWKKALAATPEAPLTPISGIPTEPLKAIPDQTAAADQLAAAGDAPPETPQGGSAS